MTLDRLPSLVALIATGALLVVTLAVPVRAQVSQGLSAALVVAWTAVLASVVLARARLRSGMTDHTGTSPQRTFPALAPDPAPPAAATAAEAPVANARENATVPPREKVPDADAARDPWAPLMLQFAEEALGALGEDQFKALISSRLPTLLGRHNVWVVAGSAGRQKVILPATAPHHVVGDEPRQWATFPIKAEGQTLGLLGLELDTPGLDAAEQRRVATVASIIGRALKTSAAFEAMREATIVDPLTGCGTRAEGLRRTEAELRRAERSKTALAILMLDLDHFKAINDRYGHAAGDAVLSTVGGVLLSSLRASDIRCRWGGEEFLVVLPDATLHRATSAAEALRQRIATASVRIGDQSLAVTTSIGFTIARPGELDVSKMIARADAALYQAKSHGRNRIRAVLGDFKGQMVGATPFPGATRAPRAAGEADRGDSGRPERRKSHGRRATDGLVAGPWGGR